MDALTIQLLSRGFIMLVGLNYNFTIEDNEAYYVKLTFIHNRGLFSHFEGQTSILLVINLTKGYSFSYL
jgi:hypothetical protein